MWWGNTEGKVVNKLEMRGKELFRVTDDEWNIEEVYINYSENSIVVRIDKKPTVIEKARSKMKKKDDELENVIKDLREMYAESKDNGYVKNPIAFSLYYVWKKYDKRGEGK